MKIKNRLALLAALALLLVGALGAVNWQAAAQSNQPVAESCDQQDDDAAENPDEPDTDDVELECGEQDEADEEAETEDGMDEVPSGTPAITAEQAQSQAEGYLGAGTTVQVELDDEDGRLIYSVEFNDGTDVKVDALTGDVIGTDLDED